MHPSFFVFLTSFATFYTVWTWRGPIGDFLMHLNGTCECGKPWRSCDGGWRG